MFRKIILISLLLGSIILTGCSKQQGLSKSELFEKKQECASYKTDIEKEINKGNGKTLEVSIFLEKIFYSPKRNSCLYIYSTNSDQNTNRFLFDYFTKEGIIGYNKAYSSPEKITEFDEKVKELQGE